MRYVDMDICLSACREVRRGVTNAKEDLEDSGVRFVYFSAQVRSFNAQQAHTRQGKKGRGGVESLRCSSCSPTGLYLIMYLLAAWLSIYLST